MFSILFYLFTVYYKAGIIQGFGGYSDGKSFSVWEDDAVYMVTDKRSDFFFRDKEQWFSAWIFGRELRSS